MKFFNLIINLLLALTLNVPFSYLALSEVKDGGINDRLTTNNSPYYLDFRGKPCDLSVLQDLWGEVENNNIIGHILWGDIPEEGRELKEKIENKIIENNLNYRRFPNDFIHGLLSYHVYQNITEFVKVIFDLEGEDRIYNLYLQDWEIYKIYDYPEAGGYYGILYINKENQQLVLAHRGTTAKWSDLVSKDSPLKTDIRGILAGDIVAQQAAAYKVTKQVVIEAKNMNFNLSFTGHSLGAWLAELSLYFSHRDFNYLEVRAVTFDSPGSVIHMQTLSSNVINYVTKFDLKNLEIITYLSAPNFVNSCNMHVGQVYRLFPQILDSEPVNEAIGGSDWLKEKVGFGENPDYLLSGLWSIFGHSLKPIIATFNPDTGKPVKYLEIMDWPVIKYTPSTDKRENMITVLMERALSFFTKEEIVSIKNSIEDSTIMTLLAIISEIKKGKIDQKQYLNYFKYIGEGSHQDQSENSYTVKEKLSVNKEFSLSYEGHYRIRELNLFEDVLSDNNKGSADWYLKELKKRSVDFLGDELTKKQLHDLKEQYTIIPHEKNIISSNKVIVDLLRERILRLVSVNAEAKTFLENPMIPYALPRDIRANDIMASFLPESRRRGFIETGQVLSTIDALLREEQCIIITGLLGVGKTINVLEYSYRQKNKISGTRMIVRWFMSGTSDKVEISYRHLALELGINIAELGGDKQVLINLVNGKISQSNIPILFIFDDVQDYSYIEDYLINLPKHVKVIITTRNTNLDENIKHTKLSPFTIEEAKKYIQANFKDEMSEQNQEALINILGTKNQEILPYDLSKVVAYIKNSEYSSIEQSIEYIAKNPDESSTILVLRLLKTSPLAIQMLQYAARLDHDSMSIEIFKELLMLDDEQLKEPLKKLKSLSLVNVVDKYKYSLKISPLVQEAILKYVRHHPAEQGVINEDIINKKLVLALNNLLPAVTEVPGNDWKRAKIYYHHVAHLLEQTYSQNLAQQAELYSKLSCYSKYTLNKFKQALDYEQESLRIRQKLYPGNHPDIAKSLSSIGASYRYLGEEKEALLVEEQALKMRQELYHGNHPDIARSLSAVGWTYSNLGKVQASLKFQEEALKMRQQLYHGNHPDIARSLSAVGGAYRNLGQVQTGLKFQEEALKMRQELYQGNHPEIARSLDSIGSGYRILGEAKKGGLFQEQALKMRQELYQGDHPAIAKSLNSIAKTYQASGNPKKALELQEQALRMQRKLYQGNHPAIAKSLNNIGWIFLDLGSPHAALEYDEKALNMMKELYSANHPDIAEVLDNMGESYQALGNPKKALIFHQQALKMRRMLYSGNHPDIARSLSSVGWAYYDLGDLKKALEYYQQALKMSWELYQANHLDSALSLSNIAEVYKCLGR